MVEIAVDVDSGSSSASSRLTLVFRRGTCDQSGRVGSGSSSESSRLTLGWWRRVRNILAWPLVRCEFSGASGFCGTLDAAGRSLTD